MKTIKWMMKGMRILVIIFLICLGLPLLAGFRAYAVTSGSMEPAFPVGSLIWVKGKKNIREGEVITFRVGESVVTHRVAEVQDGGRSYITKGDANETNDTKAVSREQILGCVCFSIPALGVVAVMLGTPGGKAAAIAFVLWLTCMEILSEEIQMIRRKGGVYQR